LEADATDGERCVLIRLTVPSIDEDDLDAVCEVLRSGYLIQGPRVAQFESLVAKYAGTQHAVAVANGTAALHLALLSLGVDPGDRVAVAAYSWPATANVIVLCGAEPLFIDVDSETYNLCPQDLERKLVATPVKAILPVHAHGGMADMREVLRIATQFNVPVIEDAACALGSSLDGRMAGTWGRLGCFSFHPRKAITTGEGGMVITDDASLAQKVRVLRNHGLDPTAPAPDFIAAGYNLRMTDFQAALGISQMGKLERIIASRQAAAARYDRLLVTSEIRAPRALKGSRHVYQSYTALLPAQAAARRGEIIGRLRSLGIETTIGTYHMPLTTYYRTTRGFRAGDFPRTDDIASRAISLPLYEAITEREQEQVVAALLSEAEAGCDGS
jgi:perosamine synthetase